MTLTLSPEQGEGAHLWRIWEEHIPGRWNPKGSGPEAGEKKAGLRNPEGAWGGCVEGRSPSCVASVIRGSLENTRRNTGLCGGSHPCLSLLKIGICIPFPCLLSVSALDIRFHEGQDCVLSVPWHLPHCLVQTAQASDIVVAEMPGTVRGDAFGDLRETQDLLKITGAGVLRPTVCRDPLEGWFKPRGLALPPGFLCWWLWGEALQTSSLLQLGRPLVWGSRVENR